MLHPRADQPIVESGCQSAQIGVLGQRLDDRLGLAELAGGLHDLLGRQEQQAVFPEERPAASSVTEWNRSFWPDSLSTSAAVAWVASSELGASITARMVSSLTGNDLSNAASRCRHGRSLRNQLVDVGVDGEMAVGVEPPDHAQKNRQNNDLHSVTGAGIDRGDDCLLQHAMSWEVIPRAGQAEAGRMGRRGYGGISGNSVR